MAVSKTPHRSADQWGTLSPPREFSDRYPVRRQRRLDPVKLATKTGALKRQQLLVADTVTVARCRDEFLLSVRHRQRMRPLEDMNRVDLLFSEGVALKSIDCRRSIRLRS